MSEKKTLGEYRRDAGLTQAGLAEATDMPLSTLQKLERSSGKGTRAIERMELRNAIKLADALGITIEQLAEIE